MKGYDLYKEWELLSPENQKWVMQYWIAGLDMVSEGFTEPHADQQYGRYAIEQFEYSILANKNK